RKDAAAEVTRAVETLRLSASVARRFPHGFDQNVESTGAHRVGVIRRPIGVCSFITPFNFPLNLAAHKIGPAIAVGCPFVLKPSEKAPLSALVLDELLREMPEDLAYPAAGRAFLLAPVRAVGPMIEDERVAMLSFTGSDAVGWRLARRTTARRIALELGGDAACVIAPDVEDDRLDHAAARVCAGAFTYAGQSCISTQRVIAHRRVSERFIERLLKHTDALMPGDPDDPGTAIGPLIDDEAATRVHGWIARAERDGAKILRGGDRTGNTISPTVIAGAPSSTPVACNEIFGPVVVVSTYSDEDDPVALVNDSPFGLQAGVFTGDASLIERFIEGAEVGGVCVNEVPSFRVDAMPYGGVKRSGIGREGPEHAALEMTEQKTVVVAP
ncbi:MAG: aldehyde dehydrogenase family protein, partial [Okeania sp. SIO3B3]|nr:aldehyde dehydrogenase family protein [Okeania sp. SIO3B3]